MALSAVCEACEVQAATLEGDSQQHTQTASQLEPIVQERETEINRLEEHVKAQRDEIETMRRAIGSVITRQDELVAQAGTVSPQPLSCSAGASLGAWMDAFVQSNEQVCALLERSVMEARAADILEGTIAHQHKQISATTQLASAVSAICELEPDQGNGDPDDWRYLRAACEAFLKDNSEILDQEAIAVLPAIRSKSHTASIASRL